MTHTHEQDNDASQKGFANAINRIGVSGVNFYEVWVVGTREIPHWAWGPLLERVWVDSVWTQVLHGTFEVPPILRSMGCKKPDFLKGWWQK